MLYAVRCFTMEWAPQVQVGAAVTQPEIQPNQSHGDSTLAPSPFRHAVPWKEQSELTHFASKRFTEWICHLRRPLCVAGYGRPRTALWDKLRSGIELIHTQVSSQRRPELRQRPARRLDKTAEIHRATGNLNKPRWASCGLD
jgi:hypothetical protein